MSKYSRRGIFQQDGSLYNMSSSTEMIFTDEDIAVLQDWPLQSPDLKIIESM